MMTQQPINYSDFLFDLESLQAETITLDADKIDAALQLSSQMRSEKQQWQTYLNALAMFAFQKWLNERTPDIAVNWQQSSVCKPEYANVIEAVCNLQAGEFKICIIAIGTTTDEIIVMPRAVLDLSEFTAHFYVVVEIIEELEQANIYGFLRYDQLLEYKRSNNLRPEPDWTYNLPLECLETNVDNLLLNLRCLQPQAIPLPQTSNLPASSPKIQAEIKFLLSQSNSPDRELWQVLTWEQAAVLLTTPDLLNWLYNLPEQKQTAIKESVVNVSRWLRDEMDEFAQQLSWILLPALAPEVVPMRSPAQEIEAVTTQLRRTGQYIPPEARAAYHNFQLAQARIRLYAVTWSQMSPENTLEWNLLLVLGAQSGYNLPHGTSMIISDDTGILVERVLDINSGDSYLYTCVTGSWAETFTMAITLNNGASMTLPPFAFRPEQSI